MKTRLTRARKPSVRVSAWGKARPSKRSLTVTGQCKVQSTQNTDTMHGLTSSGLKGLRASTGVWDYTCIQCCLSAHRSHTQLWTSGFGRSAARPSTQARLFLTPKRELAPHQLMMMLPKALLSPCCELAVKINIAPTIAPDRGGLPLDRELMSQFNWAECDRR